MSFVASGEISTAPTVSVYSGGGDINGDVTVINPDGNNWEASYMINSLDTDGEITFNIASSHLDQNYYETTDGSTVTVDVTAPDVPEASPPEGTYAQAQLVVLSSVGSDQIRYSIDGSTPNCVSSAIYSSAISVAESLSIRAIGCDTAGNVSVIAVYSYDIDASFGGSSIVGQVENLINMGQKKSAESLMAQWPHLFLSIEAKKTELLKITHLKNKKPRIIFRRNLKLGVVHADVKKLQIFLNSQGFIVSRVGAGSKGRETNFFGVKTKAALILFQKKYKISPALGYFGRITRKTANILSDYR